MIQKYQVPFGFLHQQNNQSCYCVQPVLYSSSAPIQLTHKHSPYLQSTLFVKYGITSRLIRANPKPFTSKITPAQHHREKLGLPLLMRIVVIHNEILTQAKPLISVEAEIPGLTVDSLHNEGYSPTLVYSLLERPSTPSRKYQ